MGLPPENLSALAARLDTISSTRPASPSTTGIASGTVVSTSVPRSPAIARMSSETFVTIDVRPIGSRASGNAPASIFEKSSS